MLEKDIKTHDIQINVVNTVYTETVENGYLDKNVLEKCFPLAPEEHNSIASEASEANHLGMLMVPFLLSLSLSLSLSIYIYIYIYIS